MEMAASIWFHRAMSKRKNSIQAVTPMMKPPIMMTTMATLAIIRDHQNHHVQALKMILMSPVAVLIVSNQPTFN